MPDLPAPGGSIEQMVPVAASMERMACSWKGLHSTYFPGIPSSFGEGSLSITCYCTRMKLRDLTGQKFGRLTALRRVANFPGYGQAVWLFLCDCGKKIKLLGYNAAHHRQISCGCFQKENPPRRTHGKTKTKVYNTWTKMLSRCSRPSDPAFHQYGARGISVCARWKKFENFLSDMGEPGTADLTIERVNNNKGYSPHNCRWAGRKDQVRNRRLTIRVNFQRQTKSLALWCEQLKLPYATIWHRYSVGKRNADLFKPVRLQRRCREE